MSFSRVFQKHFCFTQRWHCLQMCPVVSVDFLIDPISLCLQLFAIFFAKKQML